MAVGRVEQIISLRGENNTQKAISEAKAGISSLGEASHTVAERSGDLERGFRGVKDIIGNLGGTNLAPFIDGLGGVEAIIKGFGPALNPLTIGLAAAGTAAYLVYQNVEKARVAALNAQIKDLEITKESVEQTAKKLGLSNELLGVGRELQTTESIQNEARDTASKLIEAQIELKKAEVEKDKEKIALQTEEISRLKDIIVQEDIRLQIQRQMDKEYDAFKAKQERGRREQAAEEDRINGIMNFRDRINARAEHHSERLAALKNEEEKINYRLNMGDTDREKKEKRITEIVAERKRLEGELAADAAQVQAKQKERADKAKQYAADERSAIVSVAQARADAAAAAGVDDDRLYTLQLEAIKATERAEIIAARIAEGTAKGKAAKIEAIQINARLKEEKLQQDAFAKTADREKASEDAAKKIADAQIAAADQLRKAQIAAATDPAVRYDLTVKGLQIEAEKKLTEARQSNLFTAEELKTKQLAIETELANGIKEANAAKQASIDETMKKQREEIQKQVDLAADTVGSAASVVAAYQGKAGLGSALSETAKQVKEVSKAWEESKNKSGLVIGAVGAVAASFVDGEKEKAGILAIMELAQAAVSIATGDIAGAAAHGTAAALYGSVATGIISSGASSTGTSGAGGFNAGATASGGTGAQGITGTTTVINFNAPLGTQYEIGKSVVKAQKAAFSMGWSPAMAAGV